MARHFTRALGAALVVSLLIGIPAAAQSLTKVRFPYSPINSSSLQWMVAKENKIFEKYGLDVDMVFMGASSLILQSMLSGAALLNRSVDYTIIPSTIATAAARGAPAKVIHFASVRL